MSKPNEYWTLRRAARHLVVGLWTSNSLWDKPETVMDAYYAVRLIREVAKMIPDQTPEEQAKKRRRWMWSGI